MDNEWQLLKDILRFFEEEPNDVRAMFELERRIKATLANEPEFRWFYDSYGQIAYWNDYALLVSTDTSKPKWLWSVIHRREDRLASSGLCDSEAEAKLAAIAYIRSIPC